MVLGNKGCNPVSARMRCTYAIRQRTGDKDAALEAIAPCPAF